MMARIRKLPLIISSMLLVPAFSSAIPVDRITVNSSTIGFFKEDEPNVSFSFSVKWKKTFDSIVDVIRLSDSKEVKRVIQKDGKDATPNLNYNVEFNIDLTAFLKLNVFKLEYLIRSTISNEIYISFPMTFRKIKPYTYNPLDYENFNVSNFGFAYRIENSRTINIEEKFAFNSWIDYFQDDNYHMLDLKDLIFDYDYISPLVYEDASLSFFDDTYCFPYLPRNQFNLIEIPLSISQNDVKCSINYAKPFYVDKKTLQISLEYRPDFELTNKFFLPINKIKEINDIEFVFTLKNLGPFNTSFNWEMYYLSNASYIGECSNSDYCVIGGIR